MMLINGSGAEISFSFGFYGITVTPGSDARSTGGPCSSGNTWTQRGSNSRPLVRFPSFLPSFVFVSLAEPADHVVLVVK